MVCSKQVLERERAPTAVVAPQHAVVIPARFFWAWMGVDARHDP
jgi:hypothetical protein